jgi:DNA-binding beta-propeller fold protein YncE
VQINRHFLVFEVMLLAFVFALTGAFHHLKADTGTCGGTTTTLPFNDVGSSAFFCQIAAAYFSGLTNGTTATTYSPTATVTREQMAAFITRTQDGALRRGSQRAALGQWWRSWDAWSAYEYYFPGNASVQALVQSDGFNVFMTDGGRLISRSLVDGAFHEWGGMTNAFGVLYQNGWLWVTGRTAPGRLYRMSVLDANATQMPVSLGDNPQYLAYDGARIWTANYGDGSSGSVSIYDTRSGALQNVGGFLPLSGIVYDGANIWVSQTGTDFIDPQLLKLDANGNVIATITVGEPSRPTFDGTNIWAPNVLSNSVSVVRASTATLIATLSGNGLSYPTAAAFDGERILVTNFGLDGGGRVSLWRAADLTPLGVFALEPQIVTHPFYPHAACSDGKSFWILADDRAGQSLLMRY